MNKGDKVICIKTYIFGLTEYYTQGKEYEILSVGTKTLCNKIAVRPYVKSNLYGGMRFSRVGVSIADVDNRNLVEYFITLAEWREQQIKSVIDE
jgi:hypothetical protein